VSELKRLPLAIVLGLALTVASADSGQMDAQTIIQRSVEANEQDWNAAPLYDFTERDVSPGGSRSYEVMMIEGSPYERLIAVNGVPLTDGQQAEELRMMESVTAVRRAESEQQRAQRIARYERERKRDHLLLDQLAIAFDFELLGKQQLGSYEVYVLKATPRADYQPPELDAEVLRGMEGKLWIDTESFQWVKVTAQVIHPVSIGGFLARVERGTRFELEKMPVRDNIWLPAHFTMKAHARVLFFFSRRTAKDETYFDYRLVSPGQTK
jgi:hypothetical protein